jgi:hypothetical protein
MSLCLLATAWTTLNHTTTTLLDSTISMRRLLKCLSANVSLNGREKTYGVLAESEGHLLGIATNLDENRTEFTEDLGYSHLKSLFTLVLKKA